MNKAKYSDIVAKLIIMAKAETDGYDKAIKDTKHLNNMNYLINRIAELDDDSLKVIAVATNLKLLADKRHEDIDHYYRLHSRMVDALLEDLNSTEKSQN